MKQHHGLLNVIGAFDGPFISILAPVVDEHLFVKTKDFHVLDVPSISDENKMF